MPSWTSVAVLQYSLHKCATTPHLSILIQLKCVRRSWGITTCISKMAMHDQREALAILL
ncbi:hypothetical protein DL89DRAFT_269803, partial [Linderina pennispora]